jgi:hypothetical protein
MKQNVHNIERGVRIVAGLVTGISGRCPPYAMFGINTCNKPE